MMGLGLAGVGVGVLGLWLTRRGRAAPAARGCTGWRSPALPAALAANIFGWVLTEMGRQPWTVVGELLTAASVSPGVSLGEVAFSLTPFTALYGVLAVVEAPAALALRPGRAGSRRPVPPGRRARVRPHPRVRLLGDSRWTCPPSGSSPIAVLWTGYFVLEGFDFGVGMLLPVLGRGTENDAAREADRRVVINAIGPVWDGNEVWLITARRRDVRRVPRLVRGLSQRLLPAGAARRRSR